MPPTGMSVAAYGACSPAHHQCHARQMTQQGQKGQAAPTELRSNRHTVAYSILSATPDAWGLPGEQDGSIERLPLVRQHQQATCQLWLSCKSK